MDWEAPAGWTLPAFPQQGAEGNTKTEQELAASNAGTRKRRALSDAEALGSQNGAKAEEADPVWSTLTLLLKMGMNSQQRIRMLESCLEYSLQIPNNQHCVQDVWTQMELYNVHVQGNKNHKHGAPQVHAWAAFLDGLCELVNKGAKKEKQFNTSLLKLQVLPGTRTLANSVKDMLVKYCKAKEYHGPAPSARLERQAQDKLDKVF